MSASAATGTHASWALFLDVDGTLLEIAATPQDVHVPTSLRALLEQVRQRLGGALALVSGRSLATLDSLFAPLRLPASGVHGCERRDIEGNVVRPDVDANAITRARAELGELVRSHEGLLLEDKGYSLAVHYRLAPEMQARVRSAMDAVLDHLGPEFVLQAGKSVLELRPGAWSKGTSVAAFMQEAPFRGRTPVYVGDDVTDEDAFAAVNDFGGVSIRVGTAPASLARYCLSNVAAVHEWLSKVASATDLSAALADVQEWTAFQAAHATA